MKREQKAPFWVLVMLALTALCTVVMVPVRMHQYLTCLDPNTGFWATADWTLFVLYGGVALVCFVTLALSWLSRKKLVKPVFPEEQNSRLGFAGLLLALGFGYDIYAAGHTALTAYTESYASIYGTTTVVSSLMSNGFFSGVLEAAFALFSTAYFLIYALSLFQGTVSYQNRRILALSPVLWGISRMLGHFVEPISYRNVSQLWLELLLLAMAIIFYLSFARIASGVEEESSMWILYFSGASGAFLGFTCALTPVLLTIAANGDLIPADRPVQYVDLAFAIFATAVLAHYLKDHSKAKPVPPENFQKGTMKAPAKLFTEEPASAVKPTAAAGNKTIPTDHLSVKNPDPKVNVLNPKE